MSTLRIQFQANNTSDEQWSVQEVNGDTLLGQNVTIGVPSWTIVDDNGNYIECNGQVTKLDNTLTIRSE
jgi:hypothetical protein